jgi:hypothetical protein
MHKEWPQTSGSQRLSWQPQVAQINTQALVGLGDCGGGIV